jgi:UDP-N-acetylmuramate: L-alanyl-gamma-D-glutamyl-meso-diaminopimelate ligase
MTPHFHGFDLNRRNASRAMPEERYHRIMTRDNNHIPDVVKRVHLIAACGTAMGALACILMDRGISVTGSDANVYPPMSTFLAARGLALTDGFDPAHLSPPPDLVVVGNTVSADNPEAVRMRALGVPYCSLPQALNRFLVAEKTALVVTGTHGKTTTAALLAWVLHHAGLDPAFMIGGILKDFDSNYRVGAGAHAVLEGDEYDTAYFDKGPKFMHFQPGIAILTSVEFDHADIYRDLDHVCDAFAGFTRRMPDESLLVARAGDANVDRATLPATCRIDTYDIDGSATWRAADLRITPPWTTFTLFRNETRFGDFKSPMMGRHNVGNAVAVIAAGAGLGLRAATMADALASFSGVRRRQEVRGVRGGVTVMDDFAHHPTAVKETIAAVRPHVAGGRLIAVFEPRTNSSMRTVFQETYPGVFGEADLVCIRQPSALYKVPEAERMSSRRLVRDLAARGVDAHHFEDTEAIIAFLAPICRPGDTVLVMSNGGFDNIHDRLLESLGN